MIKEKKPEKIILDFTYASNETAVEKRLEMNGVSGIESHGGNCTLRALGDMSDKGTTTDCLGVKEASTETPATDILYITDDSMKANKAKRAGCGVLIYLHDQNTTENFEGFRFCIEGFDDVDTTYFTRIYQRVKKLPWVIKETERLIIREMTPEDTDALYSLYEDKSVVEFMEDLPGNKEEEKEYIADYIDKVYSFFGFGMWLVEMKETGEVIGRVGFQNYEAGQNCEGRINGVDGPENKDKWNMEESLLVELGFMIIPKYQRQGYAMEACRAAMEYMREELPEYKLMARCRRENAKAIELCKKLEILFCII